MIFQSTSIFLFWSGIIMTQNTLLCALSLITQKLFSVEMLFLLWHVLVELLLVLERQLKWLHCIEEIYQRRNCFCQSFRGKGLVISAPQWSRDFCAYIFKHPLESCVFSKSFTLFSWPDAHSLCRLYCTSKCRVIMCWQGVFNHS